jgi:secretion/DNA translocation related TadE-like protein
LAIGLTAVIGACLIVALTLGMAVQAKQQAQTAADLAALAGAQAVIDGLGSSDACALADRIAAEFSASLVSCGPTAEKRLLVICQVGVDLGWLDQKFVRALAEAGPP